VVKVQLVANLERLTAPIALASGLTDSRTAQGLVTVAVAYLIIGATGRAKARRTAGQLREATPALLADQLHAASVGAPFRTGGKRRPVL
jgi:hypothetical protein